MKILKIILIVIISLALLFVVVGLMLPSQVKLERSILIKASAESIFEEVNDYKRINAWSPWFAIDPNTQYTYEGPAKGVGSKMSWTSEHDQVGTGSQLIVESNRNQNVKSELYFGGFDGVSYANMILTEQSEGTNVTWTYETDFGNNIVNKYFGLLMDKFLGPMYEDGLSKLKTFIEAKPVTAMVEVVVGTPITYIGIEGTFDTTNPATIGPKMGELYGQIAAYMSAKNIQGLGSPMSIYLSQDLKSWTSICAIPVAEGTKGDKAIPVGQLQGGNLVKAVHMGSYETLEQTHIKIRDYIIDYGLEINGYSYEVYISDPMTQPDTAKWETQIYYPVN